MLTTTHAKTVPRRRAWGAAVKNAIPKGLPETDKQVSAVSRLERYIGEIYDILRRRDTIKKDRAAFRQACSALDAIGDTHLALREYLSCDASFGTGIRYILAYGVLQAVFLQQDAVRHLAISLGLPFQLPMRGLAGTLASMAGNALESNTDRLRR